MFRTFQVLLDILVLRIFFSNNLVLVIIRHSLKFGTHYKMVLVIIWCSLKLDTVFMPIRIPDLYCWLPWNWPIHPLENLQKLPSKQRTLLLFSSRHYLFSSTFATHHLSAFCSYPLMPICRHLTSEQGPVPITPGMDPALQSIIRIGNKVYMKLLQPKGNEQLREKELLGPMRTVFRRENGSQSQIQQGSVEGSTPYISVQHLEYWERKHHIFFSLGRKS